MIQKLTVTITAITYFNAKLGKTLGKKGKVLTAVTNNARAVQFTGLRLK
jgi:hypothetical protein